MGPYFDRVQVNSKVLDSILPDKDGSCATLIYSHYFLQNPLIPSKKGYSLMIYLKGIKMY